MNLIHLVKLVDATQCAQHIRMCFVSFYCFSGDSMMYQHTVSGIGCSGNSPTSTPPNINACSSSTPPLANSNHQNNNSSHENNSDQLVRMELRFSFALLCFASRSALLSNSRFLLHTRNNSTYAMCLIATV